MAIEFLCFRQAKKRKKKIKSKKRCIRIRALYCVVRTTSIVYETANDVFYVPVISERAVQYARQSRRVLSDAAFAI